MFGSLLSFASLGAWVQYPFTSLALMFDGIIFSLVSYSYNLFVLMAQLNMNSILGIAGALVDRLRALIMVFVVFRLAMSLINYLIDPGKATDSRIGGVALVKRIVITAAMLLSYNFVFALLNDINLIVIGFNDVSDLQVIEGDSADSGGLIARLVFGANSDGGINDFGKEIAVFTFQQFLRNNGSPNYEPVFNRIKDPNPNTRKDFTSVAQLADEVGKTVVYEYPFVSAAVGLFMVYSIVKMAIEIGVRMFKLLVLQMFAPVAIISYIDPASEQKIWKNYTKAYLTTYTDAFIRIAAIFLTTAFISAITASLSTMFGSVSNSGATGGIQKMLITVMVIIAGYRFALLLPKFVSGLFGVDLSENSKGSFGKFMAGLGGFAIGGIAGGVSGLATGIASGAGFAGTAANMLSGMYGGASSGMKGKSIAEKIKNVNESNAKNQTRALNYSRMGFGQATLATIEDKLKIPERYNRKAQPYNDNLTLLNNIETAKEAALKGKKDAIHGNISIENEASYMEERRKASSTYQSLMGQLENIRESSDFIDTTSAGHAQALSNFNAIQAQIKTEDSQFKTDLETAREAEYRTNAKVNKAVGDYNKLRKGKASSTAHDVYTKAGFKDAKTYEENQRDATQNNRTMERHREANMFKENK